MALLKDSLIAHYKMNENTAGDNAELVTNGDFSAWTADDPDGWTVAGEVGVDPEISEVGTGEGHGGVGTGMCNIYTSDGTAVQMVSSLISIVVGRKYQVSITVDTVTTGKIGVGETAGNQWAERVFNSGDVGINTFTFVATQTTCEITIREFGLGTDITFDNVSIKLCAIEDSSGNDHDGLAQQDSDAISVPGKINTALEFNGTSDYIEVPDHDDFTPALTPFSISAWVNMDDATIFPIVSKGVFATDGEWYLRTFNGLLYFAMLDENSNKFISRYYNTVLTAYENQWIHLAAIYDGGIQSSGLRIYLNGIRVDDTTGEALPFVSAKNLAHAVWIGRYSTDYANGTIDNVMFFSKELTALEVQQLYNSGAGVESIPTGINLSRTGQQFSSSPMN